MREGDGPEEAGQIVNGPPINEKVAATIYEWRNSGSSYPTANVEFFQKLGIGLEPTDAAVDAVCDFIEDPHTFQEALFATLEDPEAMHFFEDLLYIRRGDLARAYYGLQLVALHHLIEEAEQVLMIDSYL